MDEDGTVVYYQDSPASHHSHALEELVILEGVEEDPLPHKHQWRSVYDVGVKGWSLLLTAFNWPVQKGSHLEGLVREVRLSSLLTDDDHHLLQSAIPNNHGHAQSHTHSLPLLSRCLSCVQWLLLATSITLALLAYSPFPLPLLPVLCLLIWWQLLTCWVEVGVSRAQSWREDYYRSFEELLSQLTSTLRWLQEVEVIGRGFATPLQTLGPLGGCGCMHRHAHLRRRLLVTSSRLLQCLRVTTRHVYAHEHAVEKLKEELVGKHGYLAYTPLTLLHPHLTEDKEWEGEGEGLNMDTIKDACSLLAVQNSELLRLICLLAAGAGGVEGRGCINDVLLVRRLSLYVGGLVREVRLGTQELAWALLFNKNMLLETTPTRPLVPNTGQQHPVNSDLQRLADQVHCVDLKTHCLLQRVRAFGCSLSSGEGMEKGEQSLVVEIAAITVCVRGVADSCELLSSVLQDTLQDKEVPSLERQEQAEEGDAGLDVCAGEAPLAGDGMELQQEWEEFDEEEVYEGYVQEENLPSCDKPKESSSAESLEAQQVSVHLLHELQSVLVLKKEEKERTRRQRRRGRTEHALSSKATGHTQSNEDEQASMEVAEHAKSPSKERDNLPHSFVSSSTTSSSPETSSPGQVLSGQLKSAIMRRRHANNEVTFT